MESGPDSARRESSTSGKCHSDRASPPTPVVRSVVTCGIEDPQNGATPKRRPEVKIGEASSSLSAIQAKSGAPEAELSQIPPDGKPKRANKCHNLVIVLRNDFDGPL